MAASIVVSPFVLLWGVASYFLGVCQDKLNKKANEENLKKRTNDEVFYNEIFLFISNCISIVRYVNDFMQYEGRT